MTRVLVVDDDPPLLRALVLNLTNRGYDVSTASTAALALAQIRRRAPDLLVLDLGLPDLDGVEVIRELRGSEPALPIIVLSARSTSQDKVTALDLGAVDYVATLEKVHVGEVAVTADVTLHADATKGFYLSAVLKVSIPGVDRATAERLAKRAHEEVCPYSKATRGNIEVTITAV